MLAMCGGGPLGWWDGFDCETLSLSADRATQEYAMEDATDIPTTYGAE